MPRSLEQNRTRRGPSQHLQEKLKEAFRTEAHLPERKSSVCEKDPMASNSIFESFSVYQPCFGRGKLKDEFGDVTSWWVDQLV
ncbi:runt-related transcription factor 1 isoform X1 [Arapaima gigas]